MSSPNNETPQEPKGEGWGMLLVMGPTLIISVELLIGMFLWPIQRVQCGTFDLTCGLGGAFYGMEQTLMHYPPIFIQIPVAWFLIVMIGAALIGDH